MVVEWDVPFTLYSSYGSIALSGTTGYFFDKDRCDAGADLRYVRNDIPQADGSLLGHVFAEGYQMHLSIQFWDNANQIACDTNLRAMADALGIHLWALRDPDASGRISWTPSGADTRMLDHIKIIERAVVTYGDVGQTVVDFTLATRFPYALDLAEITTAIGAGGSATLTNTGTAEMWPVLKVYGPTGFFSVTNLDTGDSIQYDSSRPGAIAIGGGDYAEIDTFRNTIYLNGNQNNLKPGINVETSDFWALKPGDNDVGTVGAAVDVLWQAAWE